MGRCFQSVVGGNPSSGRASVADAQAMSTDRLPPRALFLSPPDVCSLQILDDGDFPPVGVIRAQAVHVEAAVSGQAAHHRTEGESHIGGSVSVLVHVRRQRPLAGGHFLVYRRVDAQLGGQLALDGGGALELVIDVNAESSPGLLELRRHVCRPLGSVSSELTDLPTDIKAFFFSFTVNY